MHAMAMEQPMKMTKEEKAEHEEYEAKDDVRTLISAGEIKADKPRLKRALAMAKKQAAALKEVQG